MSDRKTDIKYDWRFKLENYCDKMDVERPTYSTFSDRRGGRTAWSCRVVVHGATFAARYWFDGDFIQNALEDAAEVALKILDPEACQPPSQGRPSGMVD